MSDVERACFICASTEPCAHRERIVVCPPTTEDERIALEWEIRWLGMFGRHKMPPARELKESEPARLRPNASPNIEHQRSENSKPKRVVRPQPGRRSS